MLKEAFFKLSFAISLLSQIEGGEPVNAKETMSKEFIEKVFKEVLEDLNADEKIICRYFSPDYIQHVDGHRLNYKDFVDHMYVQKSLLDSIKVCIERCVVEANGICTVHRVDAIKKNGEKVIVKVIAYFEVENGKIVLCDELTHILKGEAKDKSIGSVK